MTEHAGESTALAAREAEWVAWDEQVRSVMQRIRAGWLPHRLNSGSWWWGRPERADGFRYWSEGAVPSMVVVEAMTDAEVKTWTAYLHPMAPEAAHSGREGTR